MKNVGWLLPLALVALFPTAASAKGDDKEARSGGKAAYIAFANHGGVRDWREGGKDVIYFQDRNRQWYKAELSTPCFDLPFTLFVGLDTGPSDRLDKWSAVYVKGQRYLFKSFTKIVGLPPLEKKAKDRKAD
jgi:hypothetical protein